ncbi:MAG: 30S ribosomal protein S12 methylthiotransferase RimO, partial [Thermoguttaceae bacterium]|nr:30S ribosomal protein S12 methylthiotransferase RimO [Thermoguttaceae bacterium]
MSNLPSASSSPLAGIVCSIASLGCPKNLVDSETAIGRLVALGAELVADADVVDLFLVNTCGFLRSARAEAERYIEQALDLKASGNIRFVIVSGCAVVSD